MSGNSRKARILFGVGVIVGVAAIVMFLAPFSPELAQVRSGSGASNQAKVPAPPQVGPITVPGAVEAHTGSGPLGVQDGGLVNELAAQEVDMSALPQLVPGVAALEGGEEHDRPRTGLSEEQYMALKKQVAKALAAGVVGAKPHRTGALVSPKMPKRASAPLGGAIGPESVGWSNGFYAQGEVASCGGCVPPDMALAVSENFVVQVVNTAIAVYSKTGTLQSGFPKSSTTFFGLPSGTYTTDPRAFYDWANHRFFVVMLTETSPWSGTNVGSLIWAVSKTHDPRGSWWVYSPLQVGSSGQCPAFPTLGHDTNNWGTGATKGGIYIGINQFSGSGHCTGSGFSNNYMFVIPKDPLYSGSGYSFYWFSGFNVGGTLVDTLQPATVTDRADKPSSIFLVNSYNILWGNIVCSTGCNGLVVWSISGPTTGSVIAPNNPFAWLQGGSGPLVHGVTMSTAHDYSLPPHAAEPGCKAASGPCVDTNDTRISAQVNYHAGELFGSLNTGVAVSPAVAGPIWFDVHPVMNNNTSVITSAEERQEDCFYCGGWVNNGSAWFATVQPDQENNLVMVFDYSTDADYPGMVFTSRRVTYHDSYMNGAGQWLTGGFANYYSGRWGDYTATAPDFTIATRGLLWFSAQYADSAGHWGTAIGAAQYATPADQ